ncbi:MAG TPA: regulatory iron-sulfur-containing complex subunit RicT [Gemmatimonadaceae bacterium]|jgi:cell fate regulator YaaT (PSP1 superfamily)
MASHVIEVAFKGNRREFYLWEAEEIPAVNSAIIVEADRGEDLGHVHSVGELALKRNRGTPHGTGEDAPTKKARRLASGDDVRKHDDLRSQDDDARRKAMERVRANALVMKVSDAEWQWDRKKLTFYFTAEKRVDFRTLVRELAAAFRTRIELKQIGVRDEAKRLDGIGRCGRQYCSASWLPELRPVSLGVAKDQRLSLNPTQISGACGRLMCSLRYEHEFYVQARRRFPKEGKTIRTAVGEERVISNDIFRERVVLRDSEGETRTVPLSQLLQETEATGGTITPAVVERVDPTRTPAQTDAWTSSRAQKTENTEDVIVAADDEAEGELPSEEGIATQRQSQAPADVPEAPEAPEASETRGVPDAASDRRPHRRRGRRGGRRNRGGRRGGNGGGPPKPSTGGPA